MPPGAVHDEYGMGTLLDVPADLVDMESHGLGVDKGQRESSADAARRADCAEQVNLTMRLENQALLPPI